MDWKISFEAKAKKQLSRLSPEIRLQVLGYLFQRIAPEPDPRLFGKALSANLKGHWRYRVGDYRIICQIRDKELLVMVIQVGHRREVYK